MKFKLFFLVVISYIITTYSFDYTFSYLNPNAEIFWRNMYDGDQYAWQLGDVRYLTNSLHFPYGSVPWEAKSINDFDRNGTDDIFYYLPPFPYGDSVIWKLPIQGSTNITYQSVANALGWTFVGCGDFTNDGYTDILWYNPSVSNLYFWKMNGAVYDNVMAIYPAQSDPDILPIGVGDFNRRAR